MSKRACFFLLFARPPSQERRVALVLQIFLSINRPDIAKEEYEKVKKWAEDDPHLQLIESTINLFTGKEECLDSSSVYIG